MQRTWINYSRWLFGMVLLFGTSAAQAAEGTAKGETSDEKGQQGLGLGPHGQSSNVVMSGPDMVIGKITKIQGEQFTVHGDRGQDISLKVTKDTNKICAGGKGPAKTSSGQESSKEKQEIPPTAFMEQHAAKGRVLSEQEMMQQLHESGTQDEVGALSKDPSKLKDTVGTTDPKAKEDTAKGSGFMVGGQDCNFKVGDKVRVEASDMGTVTTIKQLARATE
ncbi:exported protein of unknown function [Nitrospira japonica]|uniref:DUF5666 domain-containing protein n=1 Tax=Nitrospira japonica TaxID=1325564 RepID=A0A1W1I8J2_9BACT|nr:hypothetical protein [Nitrospira japonica]SLM49310.1 exported protein of unknown function [Nitrospira japonica]